MKLQCSIDDGSIYLGDDSTTVAVSVVQLP